MINLISGNIFENSAEALVNPVNCVGVMGKGLALEFKKRFPKNFEYYRKTCFEPLGLVIGDLLLFKENEKWIVNFPTKIHWKDPSKIEYIQKGLKTLLQIVEEDRLKAIAIPPLGCGLGGLNWNDVKKEIYEVFEKENVEVFLYELR
ncbi:MAG TPA: macro domain-containing protein [Candidatus Lokiarchaeia archaeon]